MTVFSLKTISTTPTVSNQNYKETVDDGACCIIEGQNDGRKNAAFIVIGGRKGSLHAYVENDSESPSSFLRLVFTSLGDPVTQVSQESDDSGQISFSVLQPTLLTTYTLHIEELPCLEVTLAINLTRPSFNFVLIGPSHYCVQDWEGYLSIYKNATLVQSGKLRQFTLPGPMAICPNAENILMASGNIISSYSLSAIPEVNSDASVIYASWTADVGDDINQILIGNSEAQQLFVICTQSVHIMSPRGTLVGQIKFDTTLSKTHVYNTDQKERILLLIVTEDHQFCVYEDTRLIWRAIGTECHRLACLYIASFKGTKGFITHVDSTGLITISALSTTPRMKRITSTHEPPTDYVILPKQLSLLKRKKTESNFIIAEYQILEKSSLVRITNISDSNLFGIEILVRGDSFENHYYVDSIRNGFVHEIKIMLPLSYLDVLIMDNSGLTCLQNFSVNELNSIIGEKPKSVAGQLSSLFTLVDDHLNARKTLRATTESVRLKLVQFRAVTNRVVLLTKKNSGTLNSTALKEILKIAYDEICDTTRLVLDRKEVVLKSGNNLTNAIRNIHRIIRFKYNLSSDDLSIQMLESIISPYVNDFSPDDEIGWEEYTLKSLAFSLNKNSDIFCTDLGAQLRESIVFYISQMMNQIENRPANIT